MKFVVEKKNILKSLSHTQSIVEKHNTIPILSHVLFKTEKDKVVLTSTDLEISIVESFAAEIIEQGETTVSSHILYNIIRKISDVNDRIEVSINKNSNRILLKSGNARFELASFPSNDFPVVSNLKMSHNFSLPAKILYKLINRTHFAMANEETRYYLNGVYLHILNDNEMRFVATDGHRLAFMNTGLPEGYAKIPGVILSRKTVSELLKLIVDSTDDVDISLSETQVSFKLGSALLTSRLIDGVFPDYEQVIPKENDKVFKINIKSFAKVLDCISTVSSEKDNAVKMNLQKGKLLLSASNAEKGSAVDEIEVDYQGDNLNIGFNARYLLDVANQITEEFAEFSMRDSDTAITIKDINDNDALYVLMPMRV